MNSWYSIYINFKLYSVVYHQWLYLYTVHVCVAHSAVSTAVQYYHSSVTLLWPLHSLLCVDVVSHCLTSHVDQWRMSRWSRPLWTPTPTAPTCTSWTTGPRWSMCTCACTWLCTFLCSASPADTVYHRLALHATRHMPTLHGMLYMSGWYWTEKAIRLFIFLLVSNPH